MSTDSAMPVSILHTEVGGSYGGSLRILEMLLEHSDRRQFCNDVLFYYPTPGAERLRGLVRKVWTLCDGVPSWIGSASVANWRSTIKPKVKLLAEVRPWLKLPGHFRMARRIASFLGGSDYRLVHVNNTFSYQVPTLIAARLEGLPVVSHTRNPISNTFLNRRLIRLADHTATMNYQDERELSSWGTGINVSTCGDPVKCPEPDLQAVEDLRRSTIPEGGVLIGSIGRLERQKGFSVFVRAARLVADRYPLARFVVAGQGSEQMALEELVGKLGIRGQFTLCGFCADFSTFLAALDLFVCPSLWEGGPLTLVEAILLGRPVVTTNVGFAEALIPGGASALVPTGDSGALAQAIIAALGKNSAAKLRISETRDRATQLTNPEATTRQLENLFLRVLSGRSRDPHHRQSGPEGAGLRP